MSLLSLGRYIIQYILARLDLEIDLNITLRFLPSLQADRQELARYHKRKPGIIFFHCTVRIKYSYFYLICIITQNDNNYIYSHLILDSLLFFFFILRIFFFIYYYNQIWKYYLQSPCKEDNPQSGIQNLHVFHQS